MSSPDQSQHGMTSTSRPLFCHNRTTILKDTHTHTHTHTHTMKSACAPVLHAKSIAKVLNTECLVNQNKTKPKKKKKKRNRSEDWDRTPNQSDPKAMLGNLSLNRNQISICIYTSKGKNWYFTRRQFIVRSVYTYRRIWVCGPTDAIPLRNGKNS